MQINIGDLIYVNLKNNKIRDISIIISVEDNTVKIKHLSDNKKHYSIFDYFNFKSLIERKYLILKKQKYSTIIKRRKK